MRFFWDEKVKVKANIIRGCLTQGSLAMAAPLRGSRIRRPPLDIRELLKDTRLKLKFYKNAKKFNAFSKILVEKAKCSDIQTWKYLLQKLSLAL